MFCHFKLAPGQARGGGALPPPINTTFVNPCVCGTGALAAVSGHNAERLLDGFVRNPGGFLQKGMETVIDQKAAELEAATIIARFDAGIAKFAEGAVTAVEVRYRPATDGTAPPGSGEPSRRDPTAGKRAGNGQYPMGIKPVPKWYFRDLHGWGYVCEHEYQCA